MSLMLEIVPLGTVLGKRSKQPKPAAVAAVEQLLLLLLRHEQICRWKNSLQVEAQ
jgi:hypothetical protein